MVVFDLDGVRVFFPYDFIYPEQYAYIKAVKNTVELGGHAVLEMPTGTGKTAAMMSILTSMQFANPKMGRIIYCTRTVAEMEKALLELKMVVDYRIRELAKDNPKPQQSQRPQQGRKRTAPWVRQAAGQRRPGNIRSDRDGDVNSAAPLQDSVLQRNAESADLAAHALAVAGATATPSNAPDIEDLGERAATDSCRGDTPDGLCSFYENFDEYFAPQFFKAGVYTLEELKEAAAKWSHPILQRQLPLCPYFLARRLLQLADVVVLNYQYLLDPKVSEAAVFKPAGATPSLVGLARTDPVNPASDKSARVPQQDQQQSKSEWLRSNDLGASVVVFDEAHNIDNVCIEALSVHLNRNTLDLALRNIATLTDEIKKAKEKDSNRLRAEYQQLVQEMLQQQQRRQTAAVVQPPQEQGSITEAAGHSSETNDRNLQRPGRMQSVTVTPETLQVLANPLLSSEAIIDAAIPGSIRRAEHFVALMQRVVAYLKIYIKVQELKSEGPLSFLFGFERESLIEGDVLKHFHSRLKALLLALQITDLESLTPLTLVADFCTLIGTYWDGFIVIVDPYPEVCGLYDPLLQLCCLDASLAMRQVLSNFKSVILTSGTISPLELYPKLLNFVPLIAESFPVSLHRACFCPLIVSRGADQVPLTSKFEHRHDLSVLRNYANLLIDLCKTVPDGLVCFFPSYAYMETALSYWYENGFLAQVLEQKLVFLETKDIVSTTLALFNFKKACDCGRGAVFFSVARGKVAEGVDFDRHFGRCVVLFGIPFQYALSRVLKARLDFLRERYQIMENEYLTFDAMRQAAQCVGRVIRSKSDFALMVFADARFTKPDKRNKLPPWITRHLEQAHLALNTETAVGVCRAFLRHMAQPYPLSAALRLGPSMLADSSLCWGHVVRTLGIDSKICALEPLLMRRKMIEQTRSQQQHPSSSKALQPPQEVSIENVTSNSTERTDSATQALPGPPAGIEDANPVGEKKDIALVNNSENRVASKRELSPGAEGPAGKHPTRQAPHVPSCSSDNSSGVADLEECTAKAHAASTQ